MDLCYQWLGTIYVLYVLENGYIIVVYEKSINIESWSLKQPDGTIEEGVQI